MALAEEVTVSFAKALVLEIAVVSMITVGVLMLIAERDASPNSDPALGTRATQKRCNHPERNAHRPPPQLYLRIPTLKKLLRNMSTVAPMIRKLTLLLLHHRVRKSTTLSSLLPVGRNSKSNAR